MDEQIKKIEHPIIPMSPVESSQLAAIGHDLATNTLAIQFKSYSDKPGSVYHYANFTPEKFEEFQTSKSLGAHFKQVIKPAVELYPFVKVS